MLGQESLISTSMVTPKLRVPPWFIRIIASGGSQGVNGYAHKSSLLMGQQFPGCRMGPSSSSFLFPKFQRTYRNAINEQYSFKMNTHSRKGLVFVVLNSIQVGTHPAPKYGTHLAPSYCLRGIIHQLLHHFLEPIGCRKCR